MIPESAVKHGLNLFAVLCLFPAAAFAQSQAGVIAGVVKDTAGNLLSDTTVEASSPVLIERARTITTDAHGAYRFVDLRPGVYTVTFVLPGFTTLKRPGVEIAAAFTATVNAEMQTGNSEETRTVSEDVPVVDSQNVSQKAVTSRQLMDALPSDRNYISFAAMTPGMVVVGGQHNVGGSTPENAQMLRIHGSRINESRLFVDGMSVMSGNSTGGLALGNFLNNSMAQEVVVNTGSLSAEFEVGAVTSNFITRDGSNTLKGSFIGRYTNSALQDRNLSPDLIARDFPTANRIKRIWDANPAMSGPLLKDRLWLFSSVRHWGTYDYIGGLYDDMDPTALFYTPDLTKPAVYPVRHFSGDARLTFQAPHRNRIGAYYHYQHSDFGTCTSPAPTRDTAPSACAHAIISPQWFAQVSWSVPLSPTVLLDAGGTITAQNSVGRRDPGRSDLPAITESTTMFTWRAPSGGFGGTRNNQSNYRVGVSYAAGSHALKIGLTLLQQWRVTSVEHNQGVNYTFTEVTLGDLSSAVPARLTQFAEPATFSERVNYNLGLYIQDQWTMSRLTLNLGARADFLNSQVDAQRLPAGPLIGARDFPAVPDVPNWQDLSPRFGAAYDPIGHGKTVIKATLSRYVLGESYTIARNVNPVSATVGTARRNWDDRKFVDDPRSGNYEPDCDLRNVAPNGECGPANPNTFGQLIVTTHYDDAVTRGFGVRPYNWGASLSVEHEFWPRFSGSAGYFRRWFGNFNTRQNLKVSNADFTEFCVTVPDDPRLPGSGKPLCGLYDVSLEKFGQVDTLFTKARQFGKQEDVFDGFDFTLNARLATQVHIAGGLSLGRERTNNCYLLDDLSLTFSDTTSRATPYCDVRPPMQPNLKVQGVYPLPWWAIQAAATWQSLPGSELQAQISASNAEIRSTLGRNLASCGAASSCNASVNNLDVLPPGTQYGDRVNQLDVRLSRTWKLGRTSVRPTLSVYNLLNANPVLQYKSQYSPTWPTPSAILMARFMDVGVQIDF